MECQLENASVHYETFGKGRPLVLLHGFWTDHRQIAGCMEPVFENRGGWQRIYPDLPGMGKTPGQEWIISSDQMLDIVDEFIEALVPHQHFVVGGYSYGAYLARGLVHRRGARIDGLFLACPLIVPESSERSVPPREILVRDVDLVSQLTPQEREVLEQWVAVQSPRILERTRAELGAGIRVADEPFLTRLQAEGHAFSFDINAAAGQFEKPTLLLAGRQDWVVGYRDAWEIIEHYPRATFAVLDRAGHNLPIVQEGLFNSLVNEWLDRVEEGLSIDN